MTSAQPIGPPDFSGWIPMRVVWRQRPDADVPGPVVQWTYLGQTRLTAPFFEQTLQRQMSVPFHQIFQRECSMQDLVDWAEHASVTPLRGLIFHMSRCGSTLVSQMLAAPLHHVVASEPSPLDAVLRARTKAPALEHTEHIRWVRAMVIALGQARTGEEDALFLKLDCWHVHQIPVLQEAFPGVPCIFLYREPVEVLMSHAMSPAPWTLPGMLHSAVLHLKPEEWGPQHQERYCAKALANFCQAAADAEGPRDLLLVNYNELPQAMFGRIAAHFHLQLADMPAMLEQSMRSAKSPGMAFRPDSEAKQAAAGHKVRAAAAEYLQSVYDRLEALRESQLENLR